LIRIQARLALAVSAVSAPEVGSVKAAVAELRAPGSGAASIRD
jgi:hypothetical protein